MTHSISFATLVNDLLNKSSSAAVNQLAFDDQHLRDHLLKTLGSNPGESGSMLADLVLEATFGWKSAAKDVTLESLSKNTPSSPNLLHPYVVEALDAPWSAAAVSNASSKDHPYRLAKTTTPYAHQHAAWNVLCKQGESKSVIVTSGTGSGKTECFMVPILNELARECFPSPTAPTMEGAVANAQQLVGVRALFLYPLNALIQSQQERLSAWTGPFGDKIRFCLYNGNTIEDMKKANAQATPQEVLDRKTLRSSPPPILVTNATMLEYMLVRNRDASIMKLSRGKLKWIVLDEAHSYIGSQAAEISLLLRRVLVAFGVESKNVRFIATSATIGDPNGSAGADLRKFIADLAGVGTDQVELVSGSRSVPDLALAGSNGSILPATAASPAQTLTDLLAIKERETSGSLYAAVKQSPTALAIRACITAAPTPNVKTSKQILAYLEGQGLPLPNVMTLLAWMDVLTTACDVQGGDKTPFLPIRLHIFHNVLAGLWACVDSKCTHHAKLNGCLADWPFGAVYTQRQEHCKCGSPVYEIQSCDQCHKPHLQASEERTSNNATYIKSPINDALHDFYLDEPEAPSEDDDGEASNSPNSPNSPNSKTTSKPKIITTLFNRSHLTVLIDKASREVKVAQTMALPTDISLQIYNGAGCPHCDARRKPDKGFSSSFLGAPFFLKHIAPTLLGHCNGMSSADDLPFEGKRMITFTDSRQGTARLAASLQQDSERNTMRGILYKKITEHQNKKDPNEIDTLKEEVASLEHIVQKLGYTNLKSNLDDAKIKLAQALNHKPISFNELAASIQSEPDVKLAASTLFERDSLSIQNAAELFILKEFFRRPNKGNSLETMGLVSVNYPKLNAMHTPSLGTAIPDHLGALLENTSNARWQSFLKICLDSFIRDRYALHIVEDQSRHFDFQYYKSVVVFSSPTTGNLPKSFPRIISWPTVNSGGNQSRLAKRCAQAVGANLASFEEQNLVRLLLEQAFSQLTGETGAGGVLVRAAEPNAYYLPPSEMSFSSPKTAWHIEASRQLLDISWNHDGADDSTKSTEFPMPQNNDNDGDRLEKIKDLAAKGAWSDLTDLAIGGAAYYRTAEHSAQQNPEKLKKYEALFKSGKVNLLSCSTTMEMGVDIGGISAVAMNNAPPHPANYLQRAGRAGRRGEQQAIALTICKNNPHDQMVFAAPLWAFETPLPAPKIMLESIPIAQRHANSFLLSAFLSNTAPSSADKLDMKWWNTSTSASALSPETRFLDWLDNLGSKAGATPDDSSIYSGLGCILDQTALNLSLSLPEIVMQAKEQARSFLTSWHAELDSVEALIQSNSTKATDPYSVSLNFQRDRLLGEYLLRELSTRGFLPSYGFPSHITSFNTANISSAKTNKVMGQKPKELRLPSRDCISALSEYAPGSKVVIDGGLYESAGITLNWHAPASEDAFTEIQNIKTAWHCKQCGTSGTQSSSLASPCCPACKKPCQSVTYLAPAGFSVDFSKPTTKEISKQSFISAERPWIDIQTDWVSLPNPDLGHMRASSSGSAFFHTRGPTKDGYAVCLHCGLAEPTGQLSHLAIPLKPHKRLRGGGKGASGLCSGSNSSGYAVKRDLMLGHDMIVDVFELSLNDENGNPVNDDQTAYSLAVAIRGAVGRIFGVKLSEIQCAIRPSKSPAGASGTSIILYDKSCSGYCTAINEKIVDVLNAAAGILTCSEDCDVACHHCLISYDTRFETPNMNRKKALALLSPQWLKLLAPAPADLFFGPESSAELNPFATSLRQHCLLNTTQEMRIFFSGDPAEWDLLSWSFRPVIEKSHFSNLCKIRLVLPQGYLNTTPKPFLLQLSELVRHPKVILSTYNELSIAIPGHEPALILAQAIKKTPGHLVTSWGSRDLLAGCPGLKTWGTSESHVIMRSASGQIIPLLIDDDSASLKFPETTKIPIKGQIDGDALSFGERLYAFISSGMKSSMVPNGDSLIAIRYSDRYLATPFAASLLISFIRAVLTQHSAPPPPHKVLINILSAELNRPSRPPNDRPRAYNDWRREIDRKDAIEHALKTVSENVKFTTKHKSAISHFREMTLFFSSGREATITLDQGFGAWTCDGNSHDQLFDFDSSAAEQSRILTKPKFSTKCSSTGTLFFIELPS